MDLGSGGSAWLCSEDWEAPRRESRALREMSEQARARARVTRHKVRVGRSHRERPGDAAFARLQARLGTMPVIEQAKGIIMAQQGCGPDEAFDVLRRISQRANVKVYELAAQIVERVASGGNVTPLSRGTRRYLRTADRGRSHHRARLVPRPVRFAR